MKSVLFLILAAVAARAADDPWTKVKNLKSGTELRVFKKGTAQPVLAKMDEADDERLLVVVKNTQQAIFRADIDRVDYRPPAGSKLTSKSENKTSDPDTRPAPPGYGSRTPQNSTSTNVSIGSKPDFETIYRRPAPPPRK